MSRFKQGLAAIAVVTMLSAVSMNAHAAPSNSLPIGNQVLRGYLSMGTNSASGSTTYTTAEAIAVKVRYDYNWGPGLANYNQVTAYNSNGGTSVGTTAYAKSEHTNVKSVRAVGTHTVWYNGSPISIETSI